MSAIFKAYPIGRPLGVELRLHGTLLLAGALLLLLSLVGSGLAGVLSTAFLVLALATSVTLHELGHIVAARKFGNETAGITLYPFGGLAQLLRESQSPREEVVVALAGPAVNLALAGAAAIPVAILGWSTVPPLTTFLILNLVLAGFNLIPAYPMDGGRVLRGALWRRLGHTGATRAAARGGQFFAALFGLLGLVSASPMLIVISVFVFLQASAELARLRLLDWGEQVQRAAQQQGLFWPPQEELRPPPRPEPRRAPSKRVPGAFTQVEFEERNGRWVPIDRSPW